MKWLVNKITAFGIAPVEAQTVAVVSMFVAAFVGLCLIIGLILGGLGSCRERRNEKKLNQINANQSNIGAGIEVIKQEKDAANLEVKNAQKTIDNANAAFADSLRRDSNSFDGNRSNDHFCADFPADSSCAEWRRLHNR